jgi:hypothetical protein
MNTSPSRLAASSPQWRQIAASTAMFITVVSVAITVATTADAKPKAPGTNQYYSCIASRLKSINSDVSQIPNDAVFEVWEDCCLDLGGTYNENTKECYMPDKSIGRPEPPAGATAIIPPGLNTVEGPTPPPGPTAILPPGSNSIQ